MQRWLIDTKFKIPFEKISWQIILILFSIFFLTINILFPFVADDISYAFIWDGEHGGNLTDNIGERQRIESFTDILISQWSHYFHWGGRTIAHIIVQFFSWTAQDYFDVLNVIVFCAVVFLIFKIGTGLNLSEMNKKYLLFILTAIYFFTPDFCITIVWMTGSINYLWMTALEFLFILPFAMKYRDKNFWNQPPSWSVPSMAILGLIAGWSIEPGASVTLFVTFFCLINFWREKNLQSWQIKGFVFLTIGFLILILSPGNEERMQLESAWTFKYTAEEFILRTQYVLCPLIIRESPLFLPIIFYFLQGQKTSESTKFILTFFSASIIILGVMMLVPEFPERAGFSSTIFLIVASLAAFKEILPDIEKFFHKRVKLLNTVTTAFIIFGIFHLGTCTYAYYDVHQQYARIMEYVHKNRDTDEIIVPFMTLPSWVKNFVGQRTWTDFILKSQILNPNPASLRNIMFAQYYEIKKIRVDENLKWGGD